HARVAAPVKPLAGSRVEDLRIYRIRLHDVSSTRGPRNTQYLGPLHSAVDTAVDTAAGANQHPAPVRNDREDIGIILDAKVDRFPGLAAIRCLPGKMRRAGV